MLIADYVSPAEADRTQQKHRLVRGAIPFNIEAQRWINPIEKGDRIGWFLGKVLLLHFWATWSPESVEQLAHYDELYKKHKDEGLVVIAIHSAEGADDLAAFVAERGYTLPIAVDAGASAQRYGIWSFPQSVLLRPQLPAGLDQSGRRNAESSPTETLARRHRHVSGPLTPSERIFIMTCAKILCTGLVAGLIVCRRGRRDPCLARLG